ncbi:putative fructose-2,6-bisphosphatase TIGAR A [Triplophysa tibetana]|uniref:fructose-2,6-bisphosphate 2-phosphatase n=1 Tax=Triplophysa tibetana TaxID=1572043 RepID=A0A5A9PQK9_9TELE|nr:putative fructose-2,6-bisphosphatase TIGAR A [Triplophysa tibetana]
MLAFGLTVVRHGETQCNKDGLLQGQKIDSPLSDIGTRQSEAAGLYLRDVKFQNVFVSDMKRAKQTAEIIVRNNRTCHDIELLTDPSLKERCFGIAEGGQVKDMKNMAKAAGQPFPEFTPPEGETIEQVKARVKDFLQAMFQRIVDDHRDKIQDEITMPKMEGPLAGLPDDGLLGEPVHALVVGHGAYMSIAMLYFFEDLKCSMPYGSDPARRFSLCPNTGMCRFVITLTCNKSDIALSDIQCVFINRRNHTK